MIELIVSDMDGTFLDDNERIPEGSFELITALRRNGVRFAVSSGRRLDTLYQMFAPIAGCMDFVASNGAQVVVDGEYTDLEVFSHTALCRLAQVVGSFDNMHLAVFDEKMSYLMDNEECFEREFDKDLPNVIRVFEIPAPKVDIYKASVYCDEDVMDMAYILTRELDRDFVFAPSGKRWIDVMQRGVSKATGIEQVMAAHGISPDKMVVFGDSMNDYEIMRLAGTSMAMGNGRSAIKQIATQTIGTNAEHSVQREMRTILEQARVAS